MVYYTVCYTIRFRIVDSWSCFFHVYYHCNCCSFLCRPGSELLHQAALAKPDGPGGVAGCVGQVVFQVPIIIAGR